MLNQKKLIEQFEQVVKQEIKNYQDERFALNQAINQLNKRIDDLENLHDSNHGKHESQILKLDVFFKELKLEFVNLFEQIKSNKTVIDKGLEIVDSSLNCISNNFKNINESSHKLSERVSANTRFCAENKNEIAQVEKNLQLKSQNLTDKIKSEVSDAIHYIENQPSEAQAVKEYLNGKIEVSIQNFNGFKESLDAQSKSLYILKKNIENIYTQIERLKGE